MKVINSESLVALPREVKALIRNGVYTLYTLGAAGGAAYLLVTNRAEFYLLSSDGHPQDASSIKSISDVDLDQVVSFSDDGPRSEFQVNWA
jgi:hypothetical protein